MIKRCYAKLDAYVTDANKEYEGSITIGKTLADAVGFRYSEAVFVNNIDTGKHWETYVIIGDGNEICLNGCAANHFSIGDKVHIIGYEYIAPRFGAKERRVVILEYPPIRIVKCNEKNEII